MDKKAFGFPFGFDKKGLVKRVEGDDNIRSKIIQLLFTSPGERVNLPQYGCGLNKLVFEPNNFVLTATTEFTIMNALNTWLKDDIITEAVDVEAEGETFTVTLVYIRKDTQEKQAIKINF